MSPKRNTLPTPRPWGRDNESDAWRDTLPHDTYAEWDQRPDGTYGFRPKSARGFQCSNRDYRAIGGVNEYPPAHLIARLTQCKTCGSTDVKWRELDEGWRMFDTNRRGLRNEMLLHNCLHAAASPDEFESA